MLHRGSKAILKALDATLRDTKWFITVMSFFILISTINALADLIPALIAHTKIDPRDIPVLFMNFWIVTFLVTSYKEKKAKDKLEEMHQGMHNILKLLMFVRDANSKGVMMQDLEKQGVIKIEMIHPEKSATEYSLTEEEKKVFERMVQKTIDKNKEKLVN